MPDTDLAGELDRLDKAATSSPWALFEADPESDPLRPVFNPDGDLELIAEPTWMPDAELIVWLRNHTDEIKAALAVRPGMSQAVADLEERAVQAEAERDRLRQWKDEALPVLSGLQELGKVLGVPLGGSITGDLAAQAAADLVAERDRLTRAVTTLDRTSDELAGNVNTLKVDNDRLRATVQRVEALCSNAEKSQATRIGRDFNGNPFPAILHVEHVRAALAGDDAGDQT